MFQDEYRLRQILNNLLSNAIKFTPEGGRIKVSARKDNGFLVLQVSDTGVGISEEDQQIIFEKFRQGRTAMPAGDPFTREHSGSGLGLSIVKELCRLMGGEAPSRVSWGVGSTFTVRVPWHLEKHPWGNSREERLETRRKIPVGRQVAGFLRGTTPRVKTRGRSACLPQGFLPPGS